MAGALAVYEEQVTIRRHLYATSSTQDAKSVLSNALSDLSFALLVNHRPQDALDRAQEALTLDPSSLWIETNRADALLLLGRFNEAKAIYLANRSKPLDDGQTFSDAVKGDFLMLRKYGIDTADMRTIEALLASF
jgi:predicted Zn-dependent protease